MARWCRRETTGPIAVAIRFRNRMLQGMVVCRIETRTGAARSMVSCRNPVPNFPLGREHWADAPAGAPDQIPPGSSGCTQVCPARSQSRVKECITRFQRPCRVNTTESLHRYCCDERLLQCDGFGCTASRTQVRETIPTSRPRETAKQARMLESAKYMIPTWRSRLSCLQSHQPDGAPSLRGSLTPCRVGAVR